MTTTDYLFYSEAKTTKNCPLFSHLSSSFYSQWLLQPLLLHFPPFPFVTPKLVPISPSPNCNYIPVPVSISLSIRLLLSTEISSGSLPSPTGRGRDIRLVFILPFRYQSPSPSLFPRPSIPSLSFLSRVFSLPFSSLEL